jgi:hypothetical protein
MLMRRQYHIARRYGNCRRTAIVISGFAAAREVIAEGGLVFYRGTMSLAVVSSKNPPRFLTVSILMMKLCSRGNPISAPATVAPRKREVVKNRRNSSDYLTLFTGNNFLPEGY